MNTINKAAIKLSVSQQILHGYDAALVSEVGWVPPWREIHELERALGFTHHHLEGLERALGYTHHHLDCVGEINQLFRQWEEKKDLIKQSCLWGITEWRESQSEESGMVQRSDKSKTKDCKQAHDRQNVWACQNTPDDRTENGQQEGPREGKDGMLESCSIMECSIIAFSRKSSFWIQGSQGCINENDGQKAASDIVIPLDIFWEEGS